MQIVQIVHSCANVFVIYAGKCGCWYVCLVHPCFFLRLTSPPLSQGFLIHVCPCRWCRVCTREATAALGQFLPHSGHCCWWWFNQLQKRSLLNSDNLVLSRSGHCCCCWFNQLQKRLLNSNNLWHFSWEGVHGSLGSLVILLVQPVVTNCKRNPMSIETTGIFLPGKGFLAHSGLHNSCSYHRSQLQKKLFLATT